MDTSNIITLPNDRAAYGGFWIRFAAGAVDTVVLLIPTLLVSFLYRSTTQANNEVEKMVVELVDNGLNVTIWWVYTAVLLSSPWQATVGLKVCGLRVVDYNGRRITFGRATGRYFASFLSVVLLCVGFLMIAWTRRRQGLHDFMANTLVVKLGDIERINTSTPPPVLSPPPLPSARKSLLTRKQIVILIITAILVLLFFFNAYSSHPTDERLPNQSLNEVIGTVLRICLNFGGIICILVLLRKRKDA